MPSARLVWKTKLPRIWSIPSPIESGSSGPTSKLGAKLLWSLARVLSRRLDETTDLLGHAESGWPSPYDD